jgi:PAS domain-containing protein
MPLKNGLDFLQELRKQKNEIPFILFTGKGREEVAIKALNFGADGYYNKQGSPETVYGELAHGIKLVVERKKAEEAVRESESRFAKLAAQTPGMLYQFMRRPDGTYCVLFSSDSIRSIFGCSPQDVRNDFSPITNVILPDDLEKVVQSIEYSAKYMTPWQCEYRVQIPGKQVRWLWGQSIPEKLEDGRIIWSGYNADITDNKKIENELEQKYYLLEKVTESVGAGLAIIDRDYRVVWANKILREIGIDEKKKCYQTFNSSDCVCQDCGVQKVFDQAVIHDRHEYKIKNPTGKTNWIELIVTPVKDEKNQVIGALELAVPIDERKKLEEALSRSQAHLSEAQQTAHIGSWELNLTTGEPKWSAEMYRIYGVDPVF